MDNIIEYRSKNFSNKSEDAFHAIYKEFQYFPLKKNIHNSVSIITSISRVDNVQLVGFKVSDRKVINLGTKYRTYVKLVYPIGSANKILVEKVNKEEQLKLRLESSEAFKELEEQIKNAQDE